MINRNFSLFREKYLHAFFFLIASLVLWEAVIRILNIPEYIFPSPLAIAETMKESFYIIARNALVTVEEILLGFLAGAGLGFVLAIIIFSSRFLYRTFYPFLIAVQSVPKVLFAPLFIIWFGFGIFPKIAISALVVLFPVLINMLKGLMSVQPELIDLMKVLGASRRQILLKARLPSSIPYLFAGLKISVVLAVVGAVIGEFIGADKGLGYLIMISNVNLNTPLTFSVLIILGGIGSFLTYLIHMLEKIILPWHIHIYRR